MNIPEVFHQLYGNMEKAFRFTWEEMLNLYKEL